MTKSSCRGLIGERGGMFWKRGCFAGAALLCSAPLAEAQNFNQLVGFGDSSAPSYSLPAVALGRDWGTATVGTQLTLTSAWTGLASFTAQLGQNRATVFGGLIGLNYALGQLPGPLVYKN